VTEYERRYRDGINGAERTPRIGKKKEIVPNTTARGRYVIPLGRPEFLDKVVARLNADGIDFTIEEKEKVEGLRMPGKKDTRTCDEVKKDAPYLHKVCTPAFIISFGKPMAARSRPCE
jgi:hypothetical protein